MKKLLKIQNLKSKKATSSSIIFLKYSLIIFLTISVLFHLLLLLSVKHFLTPSVATSKNNLSFELLNNNMDNQKKPKKTTPLVSVQNSRAQGQITKKQGDNWTAPLKKPANQTIKKENEQHKNSIVKQTKSIIMTFYKKTKTLLKKNPKLETSYTAIPAHYNFHKDQALNFNSRGNISFDTKRYKDAPYFKNIVKKIAKYWYSAIPPYAHYMGLIPSGEIKIAFILDRHGALIDYKVLQDFNYPSMTKASVFAITHASPFGPLPESIKGQTLLIPFIFQYVNPKNK